MVAAYIGSPGGAKRTAAFWSRTGINLSSGITNTVMEPINFVMTVPSRSNQDNAYRIGHGIGYNVIPFAAAEFGGAMMNQGRVFTDKSLFRFDARNFGEIQAA